MRRGTDRLNRTVLVLLGLILVGLGTAGRLRSAGVFGGQRDDLLVSPSLRAEAGHRQTLLVSGASAAAVVVIFLGLWWLAAQLPKDRTVSDITLGPTEHATRIEVSATAITEALVADLLRVDGVTDASARVVRGAPLAIDLDISLEEGVDLGAVGRDLADRPKRRLLEALDLPDVELRAKLKLARPPARRVA